MERIGKYRPEYVEPICESVDGWRKSLCLESGERKLYDMGKPFELYMKD